MLLAVKGTHWITLVDVITESVQDDRIVWTSILYFEKLYVTTAGIYNTCMYDAHRSFILVI